MAANTTPSLSLNSLDFDTIKNTFRTYLQSQSQFNDYDFTGSNINVLLDILSLNTFHNGFYLNMIGNEMFMDSAQLRDSVVSHAKDLNYTPRSFRSAESNINLTVITNVAGKRSILVPKGTSFTSNFGAKNYTFTTAENILLNNYTINQGGSTTIYGNNITVYEGFYINDTFVYGNNSQRLILSNKNIDTSSISITIIEDSGASVSNYTQATSLFDLNGQSRVFFVQGAENQSYEIVFGDGVSGRKPKDNATVVVEYRICNGELPNGCSTFIPDSTIDSETNIQITTNSSAAGGAVSETIESIKYNAPRHFTTQERAVVSQDYETLLKEAFPEVNAVTAFGGEDLTPPQFGKVFVAVDLNDVDGLPTSKKDEYYSFLKPRSPNSIDPVFVDPQYTYIAIDSTVQYNINVTSLSQNDVKTIVTSAITDYARTNLNNFNRVFRYSKLVQAIDNSQTSIVSNNTELKVIKLLVPDVGIKQTFDVNFQIPLDIPVSNLVGYAVNSNAFIFNGQKVTLKDSGGKLQCVSSISGDLVQVVGQVNYETGLLQFSNFQIDEYFNNGIKIYAVPRSKDVSTINNVILNILEEDINLKVIPTRV